MTTHPSAIIEDARERKIFSGAAWSYGRAHGAITRGTYGTLLWDADDPDQARVDENSQWDLASLTKPIVGLAVMSLVENGTLILDDTVACLLPEYAGTDKAHLTVRDLMTHTAGIPGGQPLWRTCPTRETFLTTLQTLPLRHAPGTDVEYSSLGFVLLGLMAEAASGMSLDQLIRHTVCAPLGLSSLGFNPPESERDRIAATEDCPWRGRVVRGSVHDENAEVLGGIAGHAGLFSNLCDLERLALTLLGDGAAPDGVRLLAPRTVAEMTRPLTDHLSLRRTLAWQGRDRVWCPAGDLVSNAAYGHTGFTGTSLWIDPEAGIYVVLLTNRVHPSRTPAGFDRVRRRFHNAVVAELSRAAATGPPTAL